MKPYEIINALNELLHELDDLGETVIDCVIDAREEDGLPPFTPEELSAAEAECDRNGQKSDEIWDKINELRYEYQEQTGESPVYVDSCIPYFRDAYRWEQ